MKTQKIPGTPLEASRIIYGCMSIGGGWNRDPITEQVKKDAMKAVTTALDQGINFFDHANIYGRSKAEAVFSEIWQQIPGLRQKIILQSKCGIRFAGDPDESAPARYDFSYAHIMQSVEGSLKRLQTDYLDILLLHRPDPLVEPEEVARAFDDLQASGKVRFFGVSNQSAAQMELLRSVLRQPLVANQLELSILHADLLNMGVLINQTPLQSMIGEGTIEYCRLHGISIQAWSPLARGMLSGRSVDTQDERVGKAAAVVAELAHAKNTSREAIVIAWLLKHPAHIQPVIGTTNPDRIVATCQGDDIELSREEWYRLFVAGRGANMP